MENETINEPGGRGFKMPEKIVYDSNITILAGVEEDLIRSSKLIETGYDCTVDQFLNVCRFNKNFYSYTVLDINVPIAYVITEACYGFENFLWIHMMYVKPEYRGNRIPAMIIKGLSDGLEALKLNKIKAQIGERTPEWWKQVAGVKNLSSANVVTYHHKK